MATTYEFIQAINVTSNNTQYTMSSIPATYTDLVLIIQAKSNQTGTGYNTLRGTFNNDQTSGNYYELSTYGGLTTGNIASYKSTTQTYMSFSNIAQASQSILGFSRIDIMDYASTTHFKTAVSIGGDDQGGYYNGFTYKSTSAINRIDFYRDGTNSIASPSKFTLYGIKAA